MKKTTAAATVVTALVLSVGGVGAAMASDHPWEPAGTPAAAVQVPMAPPTATTTTTAGPVRHAEHVQRMDAVHQASGIQRHDRDGDHSMSHSEAGDHDQPASHHHEHGDQ